MIQTITLLCENGLVKQKALIVDDLAVHVLSYWGHLPTGYAITHVPTGLVVSYFATAKWAIKCAKELAPKFPWKNRPALDHQIPTIQRLISTYEHAERREQPHLDDDDCY